MKALGIHQVPPYLMTDTFTVFITRDWGFIPVREGPISGVRVSADWGRLPINSILSGRLYIGEGRVYGRFTEAMTPAGETYTVCLELSDDRQPGAEAEPRSTPDNVLLYAVQGVRPVKRFE
jgi:serine/threonine-protein kinase